MSLKKQSQEDEIVRQTPFFRSLLSLALDRALDRIVDLDLALAPDIVRRSLALDRDIDLAHLNLEQTEALGLLLFGLIRPESRSAGALADLFLTAALMHEQHAGNIPPLPAGIALVRRKVK